VIKGGVAGFGLTGGNPFGFLLGAQGSINSGRKATLVPGIVAGLLESKLQAAFIDLLATQGRTIIPGVDLGSVLGVPRVRR